MPGDTNDPLAYARDVVAKDPMASFLGIRLEEMRKGYARCSLVVRHEYLNAADRAHGSTVHAVADQAFAVACNSTGARALALSFNISYLAPAVEGEKIFAEATPINIGRKVSLWRIEVRGDGEKLIASCDGIAYHK